MKQTVHPVRCRVWFRETVTGTPMGNAGWYVYLLRCADGSLYAGITTDPARRLDEHNRGRAGAKYTRARRPVLLVWQQDAADRRAASRCEYLLRKLTKAQKEALVATGGRLAEPDHGVTPGHR